MPTKDVYESHVIPGISQAQTALAAAAANQGPTIAAPQTFVAPPFPTDLPFAWKPVALGHVVGIADAQPFPGNRAKWLWLLESIGPADTRWVARYGTAPDQENPHFNELLIGDVGLPPIRMYRVLITLFVVAIGPLNYWILRRNGRLHLFLFTVPLAALLTSGALLAYAVLSDGLESRLRARSLTHLDQRSGESASQARLSYYVGLAPSGGLKFPSDTMVAPLEQVAAGGPFHGHTRQVVWNGGQHLVRGWLGSRMPTQYVTAQAGKTQRGIEIATSADGKSHLIKNGLGTDVRELLVCDEAGQLYAAQSVAADGRAQLVSLADEKERKAAVKRLLAALRRDPPELPAAMTAYSGSDNWFFFGRRNRYFLSRTNIDPSATQLEAGLGRIRADVEAEILTPRSYVAIVGRPPMVAAGMDGLRESQSLHVVYGLW